MKCFSCAAKMEEGFTTHTTEFNDSLIIIRHVPCFKCTECGEIFYSDDVMEKIEKILNIAKKNFGELFITEFEKSVA